MSEPRSIESNPRKRRNPTPRQRNWNGGMPQDEIDAARKPRLCRCGAVALRCEGKLAWCKQHLPVLSR